MNASQSSSVSCEAGAVAPSLGAKPMALLAFLTLCLDPGTSLAEAHARASEIEERIRGERPEIADVIVHTEP